MAFSNPFGSLFQSASDQTGVPVNILEAVGKQESGFQPGIVGSAGEIGIMQLLPSNLQSLGVTNAYDPAQNILGGATLLAQDYAKTGNYNAALQMYNSGSPTGSPSYAASVLNIANNIGGNISNQTNASGFNPFDIGTYLGGQPGSQPSIPSTQNPLTGSGVLAPLITFIQNSGGALVFIIIGLVFLGGAILIFVHDNGDLPTVAHAAASAVAA